MAVEFNDGILLINITLRRRRGEPSLRTRAKYCACVENTELNLGYYSYLSGHVQYSGKTAWGAIIKSNTQFFHIGQSKNSLCVTCDKK